MWCARSYFPSRKAPHTTVGNELGGRVGVRTNAARVHAPPALRRARELIDERARPSTHDRRAERIAQLHGRRKWRATRGLYENVGGDARLAAEKTRGDRRARPAHRRSGKFLDDLARRERSRAADRRAHGLGAE